MSLAEDFKKDMEALKRVSYLLDYHSELGVRGGLFMDQARPLLYKDWIPIIDVRERISSMSKEVIHLRGLCAKYGIDPQEDR